MSLLQIFGNVNPPTGVAGYNSAAGTNEIGLILFASNGIRIFTVVMGVFVIFNFVRAGFDYITSQGDTGAHKKVQDRLTMTVIGLVIIVAAYTIAAIVGLLLFNDAGFILKPTLTGPTP